MFMLFWDSELPKNSFFRFFSTLEIMASSAFLTENIVINNSTNVGVTQFSLATQPAPITGTSSPVLFINPIQFNLVPQVVQQGGAVDGSDASAILNFTINTTPSGLSPGIPPGAGIGYGFDNNVALAEGLT